MNDIKVNGLSEIYEDLRKINIQFDLAVKNRLELAIAGEKNVKSSIKENSKDLKDYVETSRVAKVEVDKLAIAEQKLKDLQSEKNKKLIEANLLIQRATQEIKNNAKANLDNSLSLAKEKIELQNVNKEIKQQALESLGLVSQYTKLNQQRTLSKQILKDLLVSETASKESIKKATAEFEKYDAKVRKADQAVGDFSKNVGNYSFESIKSSIGGLASAFGVIGGIGAIAGIISGASKTINEFEQSLADLSSITGATGKDLEYLRDSAIDLGKETVGGAIAVTEAYKLIASAKPELLSDVKALNEVTRATLLLSKASGLDLPTAATKLTDALNQFGAPASEAAKYVGVLAAGAKYGAAEVPQLTDAILEFGAVAKTSNVDIKESTALVELLAEKGQKGADAGTKIRNILLQVLSGGGSKESKMALDSLGISINDLKDKSIPFSQKLESLKPLLGDVAKVTKVFGKENATAAISLIENTERLKELTGQVGEFGVAEEQAATRMNTVNAKTELLKSTYDSFILSVGSGSGVVSNFFKFFIDGAKESLNYLIRLNTSQDDLNKKAQNDGKLKGVETFNQKFNGRFVPGLTDESAITTDIKKEAKTLYEKYQTELNKLQKDKEFGEKNILSSKDKGSNFYNEEIEKLKKYLGEQQSIIKEAGKKQDSLKNPLKEEVKTQKQINDSEKPDDKLQKKTDDAEKKRIQHLIENQKLVLDNQIYGYNQEEHLLDNNLAHIVTVSNFKQNIANLETQRDKVGIKDKASLDLIDDDRKEKRIKINREQSEAIAKAKSDDAKFELELMDEKNKALLESGATLTDLLVEQTKKMIDKSLNAHKFELKELLSIDEIKLQNKIKLNEKLTISEQKYLKGVIKLETDAEKEKKKLDKDNLDSKLKSIDTEEKNEKAKFKNLQKGILAENRFELNAENKAIKDKLKIVKKGSDEEKNLQQDLANNEIQIKQTIEKYSQDTAIRGLDFLINITGQESDIGKAAAIAKIGFITFKNATEAFGLSSLEAVLSLASAAVLDFRGAAMHTSASVTAGVNGGLIIAEGAVQAAKISGIQLFAEGTDDAPFGKHIVDEIGPEIIFSKSGQLLTLGSDKGARLQNFKGGEVVIPNNISEIIKQNMYSGFNLNQSQQAQIDYAEMGKQFGIHANKIISAVNQNGKNQLIVNVAKNNMDRVTFRGKKV